MHALTMFVLAAALASSPLPTWQWPLEARIQARTALIRAELSRRPEYRIEGRAHPQAFLPFEAYDNFVRRAYDLPEADAEWHRQVMAESAHELRLPRHFWTATEDAAAELLASRREQRRLAAQLRTAGGEERKRILAALEAAQRPECAARRDALAATRAAVGAALFDRFLYEVIVPDMFIRGSGPEDPRRLTLIEGGCS